MRIGIGYDIHRLVEGRPLFLGGIKVPYAKGLEGHSDADVILHAIIDALLGAAAAGDIGELFPDTDPKYKNIASQELLKNTRDLINKKGYAIANIDVVIITQEPKLMLFKKKMQQKIAGILDIREDSVSIKAKTNEGMGEIGSSEAMASYAVVLLKEVK